jgi:hypothetical protein
MRRFLAVTGLVGVALVATACGGGAAKPVARPSVSSPPDISATPSLAPVGHKGIFVASGSSSLTTRALSGYDPVTHQAASVLAAKGLCSHAGPKLDSGSLPDVYILERQEYSPDFDKVVWSSCSDGAGSHIGYTDTASGVTHDLTPSKNSSYGAQSPQQSLPIFNPKTSDLWFYDDSLKSFMSFDLKAPGQPPQKRGAPLWANPAAEGTSPANGVGRQVYFASNGTFVSGAFASGQYPLVSPDGKFSVVGAYSAGTSAGIIQHMLGEPTDNQLNWAPGTELGECAPLAFVDLSSFLCMGYARALATVPGSHGSLYRVTIGGSTLTPLQLLPASENVVQATPGVVVSPDKQAVAFVSSLPGKGDVLFTVPLKGGEPTQIAPLTSVNGPLALIDWL